MQYHQGLRQETPLTGHPFKATWSTHFVTQKWDHPCQRLATLVHCFRSMAAYKQAPPLHIQHPCEGKLQCYFAFCPAFSSIYISSGTLSSRLWRWFISSYETRLTATRWWPYPRSALNNLEVELVLEICYATYLGRFHRRFHISHPPTSLTS